MHSFDGEGPAAQNDVNQFSQPWVLPLDFALHFSGFGIKLLINRPVSYTNICILRSEQKFYQKTHKISSDTKIFPSEKQVKTSSKVPYN